MRKSENLSAQEEVVGALWDFGREIKELPEDCWSVEVDPSDRIGLNLGAIDRALTRIMAAFGYEVAEVQ